MTLVQQYMYPLMDPIDIIESFADWSISITQQQLSRPSAEFVTYIYAACVRQVTGILQENLEEAVTNVLRESDDPNPDLYGSALSANLMTFHIMRLADAAKFPDFTAKDLTAPDPSRTRNILSAFINFIKFTEQRQPFINSLRNESARLAEERATVQRQLDITRRELAAARAKLAEDAPMCKALEKENDEMSAQMISKKQIQVALMSDCSSLKEEKKAIINRKDAIHKESKLAADAVNRTRQRIVQSPERIKRTITTMGATASEDKRTLAAQQAKENDLRSKNNAFLSIEKDVASCLDQLRTMEKDIQALEIARKNLTTTKDLVDQKKIERTELELRIERVHKQLSNAQEKLERAQRHAEDKRTASQQTIERLQREYEEMVLERRDNDKQVEAVRGEADDIERKMAAHLKESETEINGLLAQYWKLRHETEVYMETLANKLGIQVSAI